MEKFSAWKILNNALLEKHHSKLQKIENNDVKAFFRIEIYFR